MPDLKPGTRRRYQIGPADHRSLLVSTLVNSEPWRGFPARYLMIESVTLRPIGDKLDRWLGTCTIAEHGHDAHLMRTAYYDPAVGLINQWHQAYRLVDFNALPIGDELGYAGPLVTFPAEDEPRPTSVLRRILRVFSPN